MHYLCGIVTHVLPCGHHLGLLQIRGSAGQDMLTKNQHSSYNIIGVFVIVVNKYHHLDLFQNIPGGEGMV